MTKRFCDCCEKELNWRAVWFELPSKQPYEVCQDCSSKFLKALQGAGLKLRTEY